jgi:hypothetical protein
MGTVFILRLPLCHRSFSVLVSYLEERGNTFLRIFYDTHQNARWHITVVITSNLAWSVLNWIQAVEYFKQDFAVGLQRRNLPGGPEENDGGPQVILEFIWRD